MNTLVESIKANPRYCKASDAFVSVYRKWQAYGGPEEGGWWKTYYKLEGSVYFPTEEQASEYLEAAENLARQMRIKEMESSRDGMFQSWDDSDDSGDESLCRGWSDDNDEFVAIVESKQGSLNNEHESIGHYE